MSLSLALTQGKRGWVAPYSPHTFAALTTYGARAGLPGLVTATPHTADHGLPTPPTFGTSMVIVEALPAHAQHALVETVTAAAEREGLFPCLNTHQYNPEGMRGADTIGYELVDNWYVINDWGAPDFVYVPTSQGGLATAIARALLQRDTDTRVVAAQPSDRAPIVDRLGSSPNQRGTKADSHLSAPLDGDLAAATVAATNGWGTAVTIDQIQTAQCALAADEGLLPSPAAATAVAAATLDRQTGHLDSRAEVTVILTTASNAVATLSAPLERCPYADLNQYISRWAEGAIKNATTHPC